MHVGERLIISFESKLPRDIVARILNVVLENLQGKE